VGDGKPHGIVDVVPPALDQIVDDGRIWAAPNTTAAVR
jgi:hypothetical protein